jgi:S-DNA-T family DNA segregation ATPase FtsK/SpoIIIE
MSVYPRNKANEILGLVLFAVSILIFLSLLSYQATDPSLSVSASPQQYQNIIGKFGAWVADFLFQLFGLAALLLPLSLLCIGYRKLRVRPFEYPYIKALGFFSTLLAVACGLTLLSPTLPDWANFTPGGVFGILLSDSLLGYFNRTGTLIIVFTVLALSLVLTTRFSIDALLNWVTSYRWNLFSGISNRIRQWRRRRKNRKELARLKKEQREVVSQPLPNKMSMEAQGQGSIELDQGEQQKVTVSLPHSATSELKPTPIRPAFRTDYKLPPLDLLKKQVTETKFDEQQLVMTARKLTEKCAEFEVFGRVLQIHPGPVVTTFEFKPDPGIKYSRITNLTDDLCLALKAESIRIDRVPGKNTVGIEVPNLERRTIYLREALGSKAFQDSKSLLTLGVGQLINGGPFIADLAGMPHLLIAGATGSGKSVGLNCMVCSMLYKADPQDVRFIMVDPKRLELGLYENIPHLLTPIVTDPKKAANALNWAVREMEQRYKLLAQEGVRNIDQYNELVDEGEGRQEDEEIERLPYIVIIVDELADLMMSAGKEVEFAVTRLAQMARAVGIHLILATQRPSVDVLTGLIKANFPCRISFRVSSKVDSRTILDTNGAEQLLGMGDMLFLSPETARPIRIHGGFISEKEISSITKFLKRQAAPDYQEEVLEGEQSEEEECFVEVAEMEDKLYDEAARFVVEAGRASTSLLQRRFRVGYGRAARLLDMMEHEGVVGPSEGSKPREVLVPPGYFEEVEST